MRWTAAVVVVALLGACTSDPATRPDPPAPSASNPPPAETSAPAEPTTRPLVLAVNARRPPIRVSERLARGVADGRVRDWAALGEPAGRLQLTERTDRLDHLPMDTVAVVVGDAMGPAVRAIEVGGVDPLRDPDAYPLQVTGPAHAPVTTLSVVGDIMLGRGVTGRPVLRPMAGRLAAADLTVGNLESTMARLGPPTQGNDSFFAPPGVRGDLRRAGFDVLSLANNHLGDFGEESLVRTVELLEQGGLETFGAGADLAAARRPVVLERHGVTFGFTGFNAIGETPVAGLGQPGALSVSMPPRTGPLDEAELGRVLGDVRRLARRADVVVVMPHWGDQYVHEPWPVQHEVARRLADAGADLVVGGHPHVVQGAAQVGDALVVHSLGNFVFDMDFRTDTMEGLVLEATFWGDRLVAADFVPFRMDAGFAPRVVPHVEAASILDPFWEFSDLASPGRPRR